MNSDTITLEITIDNLAPQAGIGIAQTWYGFHDGSFDLYNSGEEASRALEILAEDGITGIEPITPGIIEEAVFFGAIPANFPSPEETVAGEFSVSPAGLNGGTQGMVFTDNRIPPFFLVQNPGETISARVTIDRQNIANNRFFNYAAMLFPTNDGFFANDDPQGIEVFDEDGNSNNPDDNAAGGKIDIEFGELTQVNSIGLLDIDEPGSSITVYGENAAIIETREIASSGDNSFQELTFNLDNVARLEINLAGSGALTELNFADI